MRKKKMEEKIEKAENSETEQRRANRERIKTNNQFSCLTLVLPSLRSIIILNNYRDIHLKTGDGNGGWRTKSPRDLMGTHSSTARSGKNLSSERKQSKKRSTKAKMIHSQQATTRGAHSLLSDLVSLPFSCLERITKERNETKSEYMRITCHSSE